MYMRVRGRRGKKAWKKDEHNFRQILITREYFVNEKRRIQNDYGDDDDDDEMLPKCKMFIYPSKIDANVYNS